MNRILPLILSLSLLAACGQPEPAATGSALAPTAAATPAATTAEAPAAQSAAAPTPSASTFAGQPAAGASAQTAPGIMTDPVATAGFIEGRHFTRIAAATAPNPVPGQVEVNEFFMYSCIHCFNLEPYVQAWLPNKPDYINFVFVPVVGSELTTLHGQAFYAATALGKAEEMHGPFFESIHNERNILGSQADMRRFFARFGVSDADFNSVFNSFSVRSAVSRADELGIRYGVDSTPTLVVAGKYRTGVGEAGSYERLFVLIEALAARELSR